MIDRGLESWTDGLSARERVRDVATTLTRPCSVEWIREEAQVSSRQTTREVLVTLAEFGRVHEVEDDDGNTKYVPNYQLRYFDQVTELINNHSRSELREQIAAIRKGIDEWKIEFDVESRDALESTLSDDGLSGADVRERNAALRQWERYEDNMRLLEHALGLYDDIRSLSIEQIDSSISRSR